MQLLITVASLAAAIYAVAPRERQLDLRLRFGGTLDVWVIGTLCLATLYLEFYGFAEAHHFAVSQSKWPKGLIPQNATYLTTIAVIAWVGYRIRAARFSAKNIFEFQELTEELFWAGRFGELLTLTEKHARELFRASQGDFYLARLARRLNPPRSFEFLVRRFIEGDEQAERGETETEMSSFARRRTAVKRRVGAALPSYERESDAANDIIRSVLLAPPFIKTVAISRPYAALNILDQWPDSRNKGEFVSRFLRELAENTSSVFYTELERNQGISSHGYEIPPSNRLLHFFLIDANLAKQFGIYKPIGDFSEWHLDELERHPEQDLYNRATRPFDDGEMNQWPLYAAIRFFDIMVTQALHQGIEWHMWLYYFPPIVERIVRNYKPDSPMVDPNAEFPLRYSRLLYEMFNIMRGWILAVEYIPETQRNTVLANTRPTHENGNIPKSSILALNTCLRHVLESDKLGERQRCSLADMVIQLYFDLRGLGRDNYAAATAEALKAGGVSYRRHDKLYQQQLRRCLRQEEETEYRIKHQETWVNDLFTALGVSEP